MSEKDKISRHRGNDEITEFGRLKIA